MVSCIGWLLDVSIDNDHARVWIKTDDGQILKLKDSYHPGFYILPRNESDGLHLFQILSREEEISVRWEEDKHTNLFDSKETRKLIQVQLRSLRYYQPLLKKLEDNVQVKQLFNTDLLHVQQYLFTKPIIEPTSKVKIEYDDRKLLSMVKVNDENDVHPPPFSLLYFDLHTYSGILASDDTIRVIKVRYEENEVVFDSSEEKVILQQFSGYVQQKNPDIIVCMGDYDNGKVLRYLFDRAGKIGVDLELRICISSSYTKTTYFDQFGFAGLIERARFGFLPLDLAAKYSINRLIDSRNCFELTQRDYVIPSRNNNHEQIRTVEQIVSGDKGGMIISPQIGLHEDVLALDYDSEYANLIVNHNLSYETIGGGEASQGLLPSVVERFLKRRQYFKKLLKELQKDSAEYVW
jgi:DNA polymerase elongation subunit (family B)